MAASGYAPIQVRKDYTFIVTYRTLASSAAAELVMWVTDYDGKNGHPIVFGPSAFTTTSWAPTDATPAGAVFDGDYLIHSMQWTRTVANSAIVDALWTRITFVAARSESSNHDAYRTVEWYTDAQRQSGWPDAPQRSPLYDGENGVAPRLYSFQGTVANGAGGAGNQSSTVAIANGGRLEVVYHHIINQDTAARATTFILDDGAGNTLAFLLQSAGNLAAAASLAYPQTGSVAQAAGNQGNSPRMIVGGSNRLISTVVAVAASEDSAYAYVLLVFGPSPSFTLAGASTPVLTTNVSRFEAC